MSSTRDASWRKVTWTETSRRCLERIVEVWRAAARRLKAGTAGSLRGVTAAITGRSPPRLGCLTFIISPVKISLLLLASDIICRRGLLAK